MKEKIALIQVKRLIQAFSIILALGLSQEGFAVPTVQDYRSLPPVLSEDSAPLVMLTMSIDNQLFYKSFTDYDDINGDGVVDTTYVNDIAYVGYFDSAKCYVYDTTNNYYYPVSLMDDPDTEDEKENYCNQSANNEWSGNFLNWASMTRIDQVRKVLYGGYRSQDPATTSGKTILERSHLPPDAHSFAKYYNGDDLTRLTPFPANGSPLPVAKAQGITICNTTPDWDGANDNSSSLVSPPVIRVVKGNYSLWAANERWQCLWAGEINTSDVNDAVEGKNANDSTTTGIDAYGTSPNSSTDLITQRNGVTRIGSYYARVVVCDPDLVGDEDCKLYPSGNLKPIGILQKFGEGGKVKFGLMSGSYKKNKSGGVLRKDISNISDEINVATDGRFTGVAGIIKNINKFRIANYDYGRGRYDQFSGDDCEWGVASFSDGTCVNWGNPFSEIMLESYRYFAGKTPNGFFDADDGTVISGLTRDTTWNCPLNNLNNCAKLNIIAFNASSSSFDSDSLAGISDLNVAARGDGKTTAKLITDLVGDGEGISGRSFFVGENGVTNNQLCTAKTVDHLGDVLGTCPDSPRLGGGYQLAGLAYHANVFDIRSDLAEKQTVTTYGVTLSPGVPNIEIKVPGQAKKVKILPACRARMYSGTYTNCGLVDFKIVKNYVETAPNSGVFEGSFYVNWEDTEQGGDYDMDLYGMIKYSISSSQIIVTTEVVHESTDKPMGFGFVIGGTNNDGFHVMSGIRREESGQIEYKELGCNKSGGCRIDDGPKSKTFTIGSSTASLLEQPLYYAAKWGGFKDIPVTGDTIVKPDADRPNEWDKKINATGAYGQDGIPDSYFEATNPNQLKAQISQILLSILERTASGTSAAVVSNSGSGEGALYQALYNPKFTANNEIDSVSWVGSLNALFLDRYGNLRADNDAYPGKLTDDDNIVNVFYDGEKTLVQYYDINEDGTRGSAVGGPVDIKELRAIWSAGDQLDGLQSYVVQRDYEVPSNNPDNGGRHILTGIDGVDGTARNGVITKDELVPFTATEFALTIGDAELYRLLGLKAADSSKASDIVNYTRGEPIAGYRNRRINIDEDDDLESLLLGDITHSSPHAVARPAAGYDINFGDNTYRAFRDHYYNRRQVVYIGANDGMLHAFNAGFFDARLSTYKLSPNGDTSGKHPLGAELWAYVPYNLLPHLKWLTDPDYPHVYYVDGSIKHYDVNIFEDDSSTTNIHPGGWGTILVVGMRFGGGAYTLDPEEDDETDNLSENVTFRSAYVILDVTDPESPPKLIAEISDPNLGYTTSEPTLVKMRESSVDGSYDVDDVDVNKWYIAFGSGPIGPNGLSQALSNQTSKLYVYELPDYANSREGVLRSWSTGISNSFIGGVEAIDWTMNYRDDALYYGVVSGTVASPTGKLRRVAMTYDPDTDILTATQSDLLNSSQPFAATPLVLRSRQNEYYDYWIYAGTGRFFVSNDNYTTATQSYYGLREPQTGTGEITTTTLSKSSNLVNTTGITVFTDRSITKPSPALDSKLATATTFEGVYDAVQEVNGWFFDLQRTRSRNFTQGVVSDQSLVFSEFQPSGLKCEPEGRGYLNAVHLKAGIPGVFAALGTTNHDSNAVTPDRVDQSVDLGAGSPSAPSIYEDGEGDKNAVVQNSTGALTSTQIQRDEEKGSRQTWRELIIDWN